LSHDAWITPAGRVHGAGERLEQRLNNVMRFVAVKQFEVQVAAGFIGEPLEEFAREAKSERTRHVLESFGFGNALLGEWIQSTPDEIWPSAEIHNAARETFIHRYISFTEEWIFRMKSGTVAADAAFIAERACERLAECNAAILNGVVCVHFQIACAVEFQIHDRVSGKERKHVVKEGDAGFDLRFAPAVEVEVDGDAGFFGVPRNSGLPGFHTAIKTKLPSKNKAQLRR
jgi:hypothetical protein